MRNSTRPEGTPTARPGWTMFPLRVWEPSPDGWYSRKVTNADIKRRRNVAKKLGSLCLREGREELNTKNTKILEIYRSLSVEEQDKLKRLLVPEPKPERLLEPALLTDDELGLVTEE